MFLFDEVVNKYGTDQDNRTVFTSNLNIYNLNAIESSDFIVITLFLKPKKIRPFLEHFSLKLSTN